VRDKKGGKETRPTVCGPFGATCVGVLAGCAVELTARYALRSDNHGESVNEAGVSCGTPATPQAPRRRRSQKGGEAPYGPSLRSAWHARRVAPAPPGAERSDGPCGCSVPGSLQDVPRSTAASGSGLAIVWAPQARVRARPRWTRAPQVARSEAQGHRL